MADKTDGESSGYIFQWKIENISHCWLEKGKEIRSPKFITNALEGTKWSLSLYPMGDEDEDENCLFVHLEREEDCSGPDIMEVSLHLAYLFEDGGSILKKMEPLKNTFRKLDCLYFKSVQREKAFVTERKAFLPQDTLTLQCTMWKNEKLVNPEHLYARTVFEVNRRSFLWTIDKFSTRKSGMKNEFSDSLIVFDLVLNEGLDFEKKIAINVNQFCEGLKYFAFKTSVVKSDGKKEYCGNQEFFTDDLKRGIFCTLLFTKKLMENKSLYLPSDILSLDCEYICSTGDVLYDYCGHGIISPQLNNRALENRNEHIKKLESLNTSVLVNDLKSMYNDGIFSDTVLRTSIQAFPAHKAILGARSPVFRSMFGNDMKEMNTGNIDITDLGDDTIRRMLLYIYTDSLEDLQFESASKLYVAADKYEILSLKCRCSSYLIENLCPTNACDVLVLGDRHYDDDLKTAVHRYIIKQEKEFFGSQEWEHFMKTHKEIALDVLYQKILQE